MKPYKYVIKRKVRNNGRRTFIICTWFIDDYLPMDNMEYNTFLAAVLRVKEIQGNKTRHIKTVFGKIE